jgi:hypothetical protein
MMFDVLWRTGFATHSSVKFLAEGVLPAQKAGSGVT